MSSPNTPAPTSPPEAPHRRHLPALPLILRMVLLVLGWVILLVGIAGLVLPGIQGCITIAFAAAVLSLASELFYRVLRRSLQRWPKAWDRVERLRGWMHDHLSRLWRPIERLIERTAQWWRRRRSK